MVSARSFFIFHPTIAFLQLHLVFLKAQLSMEHFFLLRLSVLSCNVVYCCLIFLVHMLYTTEILYISQL